MRTGKHLAALAALLTGVGVAWPDPPPSGAAPPERGQIAPDFTLQDAQGESSVRLSDLRGKPVVLLFGSCT
jgi:cytochrome oxidase Cu insertion factor (SCO1/SenC/PrrC family)